MAAISAQSSTPNLQNKKQEPHFLDVNAGNNDLLTETERERETRGGNLFCVASLCRYLSRENEGNNQNFSLPP
jgi:hypothetical protein